MNNTTDLMPLILAGDGYQLTISEEAQARKAELLKRSSTVATVTDNDESAVAQRESRALAAMRIEVEKSRKLVKEPVNRIGKMIDQAAAEFLVEIQSEEARIKKLVGDHAEEVLRIKAEKEAAERAAFEAARAAREAAEEGGIAAIVAAKKAAAEKLDASAEVASTKVAEGVRFAWDFEVTDIMDMVDYAFHLVEVTPKRALILQKIKESADRHGSDKKTIELYAAIGIHAFKKPIVSSR